MTIDNNPIPPVTRNDPAAHSGDVAGENIAALKALFPSIVTDGKVDFEVLRQLLGDEVEEGTERYGLNWKGKARARAFALTPSLGTLRPAMADSKDWDNTQNIVIEGDNLEVLKLLRKSYAGKVKLIYIDPPYNTGKDFVYPDNYTDSLAHYEALTGQRGADGARMTSNKESSGRFHTAWLNMMYPRLMLAKELLRDDGAIFVSCDEAEQANLRQIMNGIFGSENFVADMVWAAGRKNDSQLVSVSHEYIVCYAHSVEYLKSIQARWRTRKKGLDSIYAAYEKLKREHGNDYTTIEQGLRAWYSSLTDNDPAKAHKHYRNVDHRGIYFAADISWPGGGGPKYEVLHPETRRPVKIPSRGWITPDPEKMAAWIDDKRVKFGLDENAVPTLKAYLADQEKQAPYSVFYQDGRAATKRLRELMGDDVFDFPKDETILQELVELDSRNNDLILDFFAGSGTTGHAVMAQNAADGGKRRYILVQLPEPLDPAKAEQKTAADFCDTLGKPRTIAELTKERLRRAGEKVKAEWSARTAPTPNPSPEGEGDLDVGFRVYKLATSNLKPWQPTGDLAADLLDAVGNVLPGRGEDDLLVELLLKTGIDLALPATTRAIAGCTVHAFGGGTLIVCLSDIPADKARALGDGIADWLAEVTPPAPTTFFFKDSGFDAVAGGTLGPRSAEARANLAATLRQRLGKDAIEKLGAI
jgi:adenine-specific DNA-methyltransferase